MIAHSVFRILWVGPPDSSLEPLAGYLAQIPHVQLERTTALPAATDGFDVVLTAGSALPIEAVTALSDRVRAGKGWLHVADDLGSSAVGVRGGGGAAAARDRAAGDLGGPRTSAGAAPAAVLLCRTDQVGVAAT